MKQMRSSMEDNEQLKVLMAGFRGSNLDESDFASDGVRMRLVTDLQDSGLTEALPLSYDPDAINRWAPIACIAYGSNGVAIAESIEGQQLVSNHSSIRAIAGAC